MPGRTYDDDEVREILRRAIDQSAGSSQGGLTREELLEAARDAGIEPSAVQDAISGVEREREIQSELSAHRKRERRSLTSSFLTWGIIMAVLVVMRLMDAGGWWFVWPMGVWAVFLLLRLKGFVLQNPEQARERAERRLDHRRRNRKRRSGHVDHRKEVATDTVQRGVEELLDAAARRSGRARIRAADAVADGDAGASDARERADHSESSERGRSHS